MTPKEESPRAQTENLTSTMNTEFMAGSIKLVGKEYMYQELLLDAPPGTRALERSR